MTQTAPVSEKAQKLIADAREAAELRSYRTHPDVAALRIERVRSAVDALVWTGIVLGLAFTMSNVAQFAAQGAAAWSVPWLTAWLLDPMVSLCLIGVLLAESTLARYQLKAGRWVRTAKWGLLFATYVMNTWQSWAATNLAAIVLHSVPPLVVFVMAEAITDLRDRLTDAVVAAHTWARDHRDHVTDRDALPGPVGIAPSVSAEQDQTPTAEDHVSVPGPTADLDPLPAADQSPAAVPVEEHDRETARQVPEARTKSAGPDVSDLIEPGRRVQARLAATGQSLTRRALIAGLREDGHGIGTARANALLHVLTTEPTEDTTTDRSGATAASQAA
ncbi:MAG: hypothetical protein GEV07_30860 [Streptosporangiales bacterium]|nr:hypothetical protein [Streptosporangiales bacterium]